MKKKVEAKNSLENYTYNMRNTIRDDKFKSRLSEEDREKIEKAVEETLQWLEANQLAEVEEFEYKQKGLEEVCSPIISRMYQQTGGETGGDDPGMGGAANGGGRSGPKIEEVD